MASSVTDPLNLGLSGLASGIDTSTIVTQLMAINAQPQNRLKLQQATAQSRLTALQSLQTELQNLKDSADGLSSSSLFLPVQSVDSSDSSKVSATRVSGAGTGGTQLLVSRLASSQQRTYAYTPSASDTTLDFGGGKSVTVLAGTSVDDLVQEINSSTGLPVYAASIADPSDPTGTNRLLVLSSKTPGSGGDFSLGAGNSTPLVEDTGKAKAHAASAWQHTFDYTPDAVNPTTITINGNGVSVAANATIDDVVDDINNASVGVTASKDQNGRLVLTSGALGSAGDFTTSGSQVSEFGAGSAGVDSTLTNLNAAYSVDGGPSRYATSNILTDAIPGLQLTLKAASANPVTITVGSPAADNAAIKAKVHAFVNLYNANMADISAKLAERPVLNATNATDAAKGMFFADSSLQSIRDSMRTALMSPIGNNPSLNLLSQLGISTGDTTGSGTVSQDAVDGKLVVDDDKLDAMINSNPDGVKALLGATLGQGGFSQAVDSVLGPRVRASGDFDTLIQQTNSQIRDLTDQIAGWDTRLSDMQDRLKAQFSAMELALSQNQTQGQWLAGQIASLSK
jgi:flagellar hook-associated protein 2